MSNGSEWQETYLMEIAGLRFGATPSRNVDHFWDRKGDGFPWVSIADMRVSPVFKTAEQITKAGIKGSSVHLVTAGTPLMSFKLTIGRVAVAGVDLYTNEAIVAVNGKAGVANNRWLFHALPRVASAGILDSAVKGNTLNKDKLQKLELHLPPVSEQRRIAEILDTADEASRATERLIAKLEQARQGLLHDLFNRGIDQSGHLRSRHHADQFTDSPIGTIPKDWEVKKLTDIGRVRSGATPSRSMSTRYFSRDGLPWVKTLDLNEGFIYDTDERISAMAMRECSCPWLSPGSVLLAMYGGWAQIGRTGLLAVPASINQAISSVELQDSTILPEYLLIALQCGRERWKAIGASTRKDPNITRQDVLAFEVPVPSVLEQERVIAISTQSKARIVSEHDNLRKLRLLKQGLMDDLLTGRVRVGTSG